MKLKKKVVKKLIEWAFVLTCTIVLFVFARHAAVAWRGNDLWGGEVLMLTLPAFYAMVKSVVRDLVEDTERE